MVLSLEFIVKLYIKHNVELVADNWKRRRNELPPKYSEIIFELINIKYNGFPENLLECFDSEFVVLNRLNLNGINLSTIQSLSPLRKNNFTSIKVYKISWDVIDLFVVLKSEHLRNITIACTQFSYLKFPNFWEKLFENVAVKNIVKLNFSFTNLNDKGLKYLCKEAINLRSLNISGTDVTTLKYVTNLENLVVFKLSCISKCLDKNEINYLMKLSKLQKIIYLTDFFFADYLRYYTIAKISSEFFIEGNWKDLQYLSIPIPPEATSFILRSFINRHEKMKFFRICNMLLIDFELHNISNIIYPRRYMSFDVDFLNDEMEKIDRIKLSFADYDSFFKFLYDGLTVKNDEGRKEFLSSLNIRKLLKIFETRFFLITNSKFLPRAIEQRDGLIESIKLLSLIDYSSKYMLEWMNICLAIDEIKQRWIDEHLNNNLISNFQLILNKCSQLRKCIY